MPVVDVPTCRLTMAPGLAGTLGRVTCCDARLSAWPGSTVAVTGAPDSPRAKDTWAGWVPWLTSRPLTAPALPSPELTTSRSRTLTWPRSTSMPSAGA